MFIVTVINGNVDHMMVDDTYMVGRMDHLPREIVIREELTFCL